MTVPRKPPKPHRKRSGHTRDENNTINLTRDEAIAALAEFAGAIALEYDITFPLLFTLITADIPSATSEASHSPSPSV